MRDQSQYDEIVRALEFKARFCIVFPDYPGIEFRVDRSQAEHMLEAYWLGEMSWWMAVAEEIERRRSEPEQARLL